MKTSVVPSNRPKVLTNLYALIGAAAGATVGGVGAFIVSFPWAFCICEHAPPPPTLLGIVDTWADIYVLAVMVGTIVGGGVGSLFARRRTTASTPGHEMSDPQVRQRASVVHLVERLAHISSASERSLC